jgi:hypothetical protein
MVVGGESEAADRIANNRTFIVPVRTVTAACLWGSRTLADSMSSSSALASSHSPEARSRSRAVDSWSVSRRTLETSVELAAPAGVRVQEVERNDPCGLAMQELPPRRARRRGAGSMPAARRISHMVDAAIVTPSFVSLPSIRRYA